MSSVVKIKSKNGKANARINDGMGFGTEDFENEEEYFKKLEEEKKQRIFEEGKQSAVEDLEKKFAADLSVKYEEYDKIMLSINEQLNEYQKSFDKIVIDLSFLIAEKIVKKTISQETVVMDTIKEATNKIIGANNILLRLNPADMDLIKETNQSILENNSYSNINYEVDERIEKGGCYIESEIGNVDARISSQLNELKSKIENKLFDDEI